MRFLGAAVFGLAFVLVAACESNGDGHVASLADGGDASPADAGDSDASEASDAGGPEPLVDASVPPVTCAVTPCAVEIAAGSDSVCVRLSDGTVRCWGNNVNGELGRGPESGASANLPAPVVGLNDAMQITGSISLPGDVYCARRASGTAVCWGSNENGVLGRSAGEVVDTASSPTPEPVAGIGPVAGVFAGPLISCAILAGNEVACWGSNAAAQIPGKAHDGGEPFPATTFSLGASGSALAVADRGTVALTDTGLLSWGLAGELRGSRVGVLGREVSLDVGEPARVDLAHVSAVGASAGRACAITNGRVFCWGVGPTPGSDSVYPAYSGIGASFAYAQTIAVGPRSACATVSDGTAYCWGDNTRGQLGVGDFDPHATPVRVEKLAGVPVRMAVMEATSCAILATGAVQCWGLNDKGQLGTGATDALPHAEPQNVVLTP
jgi:alpha-tubulin suppressor-like RCC1 family protein